MVKSVEKLGSAKRFGARYGTKPKYKFAQIEKEQRKKHKCPYCNAIKVKRLVMGIWHCKNCNAKFTGKAYTIAKPASSKEAKSGKEPENVEEEIQAEELQEEVD